MKLFPYLLTKKEGTLTKTKLTVFLAQGGRRLWETNETTITQRELLEYYLEPNDLHADHIHFAKDIIYIKINPEKTKLDEFYSWEETNKMQQKPECWRNFYFFTDENNASWFSPKSSQLEIDFQDGNITEYYKDILRLSSV